MPIRSHRIWVLAFAGAAVTVLLGGVTAINAYVPESLIEGAYQQYSEDRFGGGVCSGGCSGRPCCSITVYAE